MRENVFPIRIPYQQRFVRRGRRKAETSWFLDEGAISIRDVDSESAPIAYRVDPGEPEPTPLDRPYAVRFFEGSLWWPLLCLDGPVSQTRFVEFAGKGYAAALLALDPSIPVPSWNWPLRLFGDFPVRPDPAPCSTRDERWAWTRRNAIRVIFCEGVVLLEAGEPIAYAIPFKSGYKIAIGHCALDRREKRFVLPGPDHGRRVEVAQRGRAVSMDELHSEVDRLIMAGSTVKNNVSIEILRTHHTSKAATLLCSHAVVEAILGRALNSDHHMTALRRAMPDLMDRIWDADHLSSSDELEMIEQFAQANDIVMQSLFYRELRIAQELKRRARAMDISPLAQEDEEALASLAQ